MDSDILHQHYFKEGTTGHALMKRFYARYADLLRYANLLELNDVVHEVYVSISRSDLSHVYNIEHYIMRAIKLHCWSLIDNASRQKRRSHENRPIRTMQDAEWSDDTPEPPATNTDPTEALQHQELLVHINLFKEFVSPGEARILNHMIDGTPREEIARSLDLGLNTLDTRIRRIRIKLVRYLVSMGHFHPSFKRFAEGVA